MGRKFYLSFRKIQININFWKNQANINDNTSLLVCTTEEGVQRSTCELSEIELEQVEEYRRIDRVYRI